MEIFLAGPPCSFLSPIPILGAGTSLSDSINLLQQPGSACSHRCTPNVGHPLS